MNGGGEGAKISREGRFYSFQAVGRGAARLKHGEISHSAERDLRLRLKNLPPFEKGGPKLFRFCDSVTEKVRKNRYNINVINESEVLKWNTFTI